MAENFKSEKRDDEARALNKNSVSIAGEYAVLSQLAARGYDANMTLGRTKGVDILVSDPNSGPNVEARGEDQSRRAIRQEHTTVWKISLRVDYGRKARANTRRKSLLLLHKHQRGHKPVPVFHHTKPYRG